MPWEILFARIRRMRGVRLVRVTAWFGVGVMESRSLAAGVDDISNDGLQRRREYHVKTSRGSFTVGCSVTSWMLRCASS
jgi:hypothetical protein